MEFFIKKGATLPLLKLNIVNNGRNDYDNFLNTLELSSLFFSMTNVDTGIPKIVNKPAGIGGVSPNYFVYYQFQNSDTTREGRFEAEFYMKNSDGSFILTLGEKLFVNIMESFITDDLSYSSCYVVDYACCNNPNPEVIFTLSQTPTPTMTYTPSVTPTETTTPTPTPSITMESTPSPTPTNTPTPTETPTMTPTQSETPTPTPTETLTPTPTPSAVSSTEVILSYDATDCGVTCNEYYTGPTSSYYIATSLPLTTGNVLYTNASLTTLADLGFYSDGTFCYEFCNNSGTIEICSILSCG